MSHSPPNALTQAVDSDGAEGEQTIDAIQKMSDLWR